MIERSQALAALAEDEFDVVVVGGGITGAGVALDAATRGYSVALLERADFASGTSSRSSKLVHGGLRYLQNFDLGLVREALLERQLMVALAPHLVHPLPLVVPAFEGAHPDRLVGVGLNLYDVMSVDRDRLRGRRGRRARAERTQASLPAAAGDGAESWSPERHRVISGEEVLELLPALAAREPTSGYLFYDCQTDDVRLVLTVLGEAERFGAVCANRLDVTGLLERDGRAEGVEVLDGESGERFQVRAGNVVNATGVWADQLRPQELHEEAELPRIRPSRGTHITISHADLPLVGGAIVPAGAGRSIFALPWLGHTLVGTTDNDYEGPLEHIRPSGEDVDYLLAAVNRFFATSLGPSELTGAFAGVRPLISSGDPKKSVDISRKAELYETSSGMITITGGKLTTWRRMAKMTVDRLVERDARDAPCRTHEVPLGQAIEVAELPRVEGVAQEAYQPLASRYGYAAREVLALAAERGGARTADRCRPSRSARRGGARRPARAGALDRRCAAAPHPPGPAGGPRAHLPAGAGRSRPPGGAGGRRARARARLGRRAPGDRAGAFRRGGRRGGDSRGSSARGAPRASSGAAPSSDAVSAPTRTLSAGGRTIELGARPLLMGIVNASPDSFSDGGLHRGVDAQLTLAAELLGAGADILDIGGESASTGRPPIEAHEEIERVVPLIERAVGELGALVSVDTYKPDVAAAAIAAGASIVNDVSGLRDPRLAELCARTGAALVLMHTRAAPRQRLQDPDLYGDVVVEVLDFLRERMQAAIAGGMRAEQLILDPGPDFTKTPAQTIRLLAQVQRLHELGRPLLMAISRKDFIGALTGRSPRERQAGTLAALAHGLERGGHIFRVHDVAGAADFIAVRAALTGDLEPSRDLALDEEIRYETLG